MTEHAPERVDFGGDGRVTGDIKDDPFHRAALCQASGGARVRSVNCAVQIGELNEALPSAGPWLTLRSASRCCRIRVVIAQREGAFNPVGPGYSTSVAK